MALFAFLMLAVAVTIVVMAVALEVFLKGPALFYCLCGQHSFLSRRFTVLTIPTAPVGDTNVAFKTRPERYKYCAAGTFLH